MLTWVEVSKKNLLYNVQSLRRAIGSGPKLLAVVKSNAYGHGMKDVAKVLQGHVDCFGVASLEEAFSLRAGIHKTPILVLSFYDQEEALLKLAIKKNISLPVYSLKQIRLLNRAGTRSRPALVHIKIDTGTSRIGFLPTELDHIAYALKQSPHVKVEGVFSHFADSEGDEKYTVSQMKSFDLALKKLGQGKNVKRHIACSAATLLYPESRYDLVRVGIMLYGLHPSKKAELSPKRDRKLHSLLSLRPVMVWKTRIVQIKNLPIGTYVGYGRTFQAKRLTRMAILPVGYADGYDRKLSNKGIVIVSDKLACVIGRVCMNLTMVDVTGIPAQMGQEVVLIGKSGNAEISATEVAEKVGTINHEVITRINWQIPRIVV